MLDNLTKRIAGVFSGLRKKGKLTEDDVTEALREIRVALLEADVNLKVAKEFIARVKEKAVGQEIFSSLTAEQSLVRIVRDELIELLGEEAKFRWSPQPPTVILMVGLQGSGKTTTTAKLAHHLMKDRKKVILAACDVQRPAAVEQLKVLGGQIGCEVVHEEGRQPWLIAAAALDRTKRLFADVLIVDTAGRLTIDEPLMQELEKIRDAVKPSETLLVLDSTTGQEAVRVAESFHERFSLTGVIFSKLDGDTRGGAILSVRASTGVPVRFLGVGEQVEALDRFMPDRIAGRILDMGDVLGLIEKAEQAVDFGDVESLQSKLTSGKFDFNDMLSQFRMVRKMGPLKGLLKMLPGVQGAIPEEALDQFNEKDMSRIEAIVLSMTPKERTNPDILNGSRRKRIARGAGVKAEDVNRLIDGLYQMRRNLKQFSKMESKLKKKGRGLFGRGGPGQP
jgi:signal recognition particle subunit SRP54